MSAVAEPILYGAVDDGLARRNAMVLAVAQALAGGNNTVTVSTASIVGAVLAPEKGLATLPITAMVLGMWVGTLPVGYLARHYGRRFALQTGSVFGVISGLISCTAVMQGNFWLMLLGTFCGGLYAAAHNSYRFAAADTASARTAGTSIAATSASARSRAASASRTMVDNGAGSAVSPGKRARRVQGRHRRNVRPGTRRL